MYWYIPSGYARSSDEGLVSKGGGLASKGGGLASKGGGLASKGGGLASKGGGLASKGGGLASKGVSPTFNCGLLSKGASSTFNGGSESFIVNNSKQFNYLYVFTIKNYNCSFIFVYLFCILL
jgi:hypothetical protein